MKQLMKSTTKFSILNFDLLVLLSSPPLPKQLIIIETMGTKSKDRIKQIKNITDTTEKHRIRNAIN